MRTILTVFSFLAFEAPVPVPRAKVWIFRDRAAIHGGQGQRIVGADL